MLKAHVSNLTERLEDGSRTGHLRVATSGWRQTVGRTIWDGFIPEPVSPEQLGFEVELDLEHGLKAA